MFKRSESLERMDAGMRDATSFAWGRTGLSFVGLPTVKVSARSNHVLGWVTRLRGRSGFGDTAFPRGQIVAGRSIAPSQASGPARRGLATNEQIPQATQKTQAIAEMIASE